MNNDNDFLSGFNLDTGPFNQALQNSMQIFHQTWQGLSQNTGIPFATPPMNLEELNKRIEELKHIENWLKMNLAMLSTTIQGLEMQRDSIVSFKEMVQTVSVPHKNTPSLEEVLRNFSAASGTDTSQATTSSAQASDDSSDNTDNIHAQTKADTLQQVGQAWWDMMQNQLATLLTAQKDRLTAAAEQEQTTEPESAQPATVTSIQQKRATRPVAKKISKTKAESTPPTDTPVAHTQNSQSTTSTSTIKAASSPPPRARGKMATKLAATTEKGSQRPSHAKKISKPSITT